MLSIGDGVAVFGGLATAAFTTIKILAPGKSSNSNGYVTKEVCTVQHNETNRRLDRIEKKLDSVLAGRGNE